MVAASSGPFVPGALVPPPGSGRVFRTQARVRLGDVTPTGRMRCDALVRHLQDVAADDSRDSRYADADAWVVRRTAVHVHRFPTHQQVLHTSTWCGGLGSHWAERRTRVVDDAGGLLVDTATLWVRVDLATMRPAPVGDEFRTLYAEAAAGRTVSAKLTHPSPPADAVHRPWPLRFADFDALGHVNNAAGWVPVEEHLAGRRDLRPGEGHGLVAEIEHRRAVERQHDITVATVDHDSGFDLWWVDAASGPLVSARVTLTTDAA